MPARSRPCCDLGLFDLPPLRNFRTRCRSKVRKKNYARCSTESHHQQGHREEHKRCALQVKISSGSPTKRTSNTLLLPILLPPNSHQYILSTTTMQAFGGTNEVLSWTSEDPRQSSLFGPWGVVYRFQVSLLCPPYCWATVSLTIRQTDVNRGTTTLYRSTRANKEDRVARLEWGPNGGLGRAVIGKVGVTFRP